MVGWYIKLHRAVTSVLSTVDYRPIPVHSRFVPIGRDEAQGCAGHHALLGAGVFTTARPHTGLAGRPGDPSGCPLH